MTACFCFLRQTGRNGRIDEIVRLFDSRIRPSIALERSSVDRQEASGMRVRASKASRRASGSRAAHARTHRSRLNHEDVRLHPFLLRGARLRQGTSLARVHGARANPDRRDARNAGAPMPSFRGACVPANSASGRDGRLPRERGRRDASARGESTGSASVPAVAGRRGRPRRTRTADPRVGTRP